MNLKKNKCPFYISNQGNGITCEGLISKTTCTQNFFNPASKNKHLNKFCYDNYNRCEFAKALMEQNLNWGNMKN